MIIGITGNIGSGKSTVSRRLAELGAEVIDTDSLARDVVAPGTTGLDRIVSEFGTCVLDEKGELDRPRMASLVFNNPEARLKLEEIVHPEIQKKVNERIADYREGRGKFPALAVEVPLLIESGWHRMMDETWVVTVGRDDQIKRVMARSGLTREEVINRINAQLPQEEKCKFADRIINNSGPVGKTIEQVDSIWQELMESKGRSIEMPGRWSE